MILAADFFTVEVSTARNLLTHYVLFAIDLETQAVRVVDVAPNPDASFLAQVARNLTDSVDGFLHGKRFLILDRDSMFTWKFKASLKAAGTGIIRTAIIFLESVVWEYIAHCQGERDLQGSRNAPIEPEPSVGQVRGKPEQRCHLGGLLSY